LRDRVAAEELVISQYIDIPWSLDENGRRESEEAIPECVRPEDWAVL
jgi:hypothetical protein